jgi:hypothetical protein
MKSIIDTRMIHPEIKYYDQDIEIYESESASGLLLQLREFHPDLVDQWNNIRQIGWRGESAKHSVVSTLRNALGDPFDAVDGSRDNGAEVSALGAHYIAITTDAFIDMACRWRMAVTKSPCVVEKDPFAFTQSVQIPGQKQNRNITFRLMLTPTEREQLNTLASDAGQTPSQYVRSVVFPKS